jgi:TorA maturation chaperone TorD
MYLLFARLLREAPSASLLQEVVQQRLLTLAEQWDAGQDVDTHPLDPAEDPGWPEQVDAIAIEYAHVFAVPGERSVTPYESFYCDSLVIDTSTACSAYFEAEPQPSGLPGFLSGPSSAAVRQAYRRAGLELDPASHELPDHLAIELEFMGRLLERCEDEQAKAFFSEHLGRWVFRCLEDITRSSAGFYRAVAEAHRIF